MRPSRRWCFAIALLSLASCPEAGIADESTTAGQTAAGSVLNRFGSTEGIRQNASNPLTAGGQLQSVDGSSTGSVTLTNPSSTAFLTVLVQPGATGDLTTVQIAQDTDFNGQADYSFVLPVRVSGVCGNGIISCNAGTWENCVAYRWTADADGKASLEGVSLSNLGGCYCLNQSCGSSLPWSNLGLVLKDLGGGVVGAVQKAKDRYVVTQVSIDGSSISYYGQNTSNSGGSSTQAQYLGNPAALASDAEGTTSTQAGDPNSLYSAMLSGFLQRGTSHSSNTCPVTRNISVTGPNCHAGTYNPLKNKCERTFATWNMGTDNSASAFLSWDGTDFVGSGGWNTYPATTTCTPDSEGNSSCYPTCNPGDYYDADYGQCVDNSPAILPRWTTTLSLEAGETVYVKMVKDAAGSMQDTYAGMGVTVNGQYLGHTTFSGHNYPWNMGEDYAKVISYTAPTAGDYLFRVWAFAVDPGSWWLTAHTMIASEQDFTCNTSENIINNCQSLENNTDCKLQEETVDGVTTYQNYNPTLLSPLPSAKTYGDNICATEFTRNWWRKDRTYFCRTDSNFDMAEAGQRVDTITRSTLNSGTGASIPYDDLRKDPNTGEWLASSHAVQLPDLPGVDDCQLVCKTRKPVQDTQAGATGTTTSYRTSSQAWEFFYKTCTADAGCPVESGEEIIKDCQCLNEFAEAASIMTVLDTASRDLICSDGNKK